MQELTAKQLHGSSLLQVDMDTPVSSSKGATVGTSRFRTRCVHENTRVVSEGVTRVRRHALAAARRKTD
jgi:hypothetical protein